MTGTDTLRPSSTKYNGTGRADSSKVSDASDSTYVEWGSGDNNKRDEYYLEDGSSSAYAYYSVTIYERGQGVGAVYETFRLYDGSSNEICSVVDNWLNSLEQNNSSANTNARSVGNVNGFWTRCQPWEIDVLQKFRQMDVWVSASYYTKTEASPQFIETTDGSEPDGYWYESKAFHVHAIRATSLNWFDQTIYLEYSYNGGAWTACANATNDVNYTYSNGEAGKTIQFRARCTVDGGTIYSDYTYSNTKTFVKPTATSFTTTSQEVRASSKLIEWSAGSCQSPYYYLEKSYNGGAYSQIYSGSTASYTHSFGDGYGTYTYKVRLNSDQNTNNYSDYSSTITITYLQSNKVNGKDATKVYGKSYDRIGGK